MNPLPQIVVHVLTAVTATATLLATQALISNRTEKLVTGLAGILIPVGWELANALWRLAHARENAARTIAGHGGVEHKARR